MSRVTESTWSCLLNIVVPMGRESIVKGTDNQLVRALEYIAAAMTWNILTDV
jgi:hypothetical protein